MLGFELGSGMQECRTEQGAESRVFIVAYVHQDSLRSFLLLHLSRAVLPLLNCNGVTANSKAQTENVKVSRPCKQTVTSRAIFTS